MTSPDPAAIRSAADRAAELLDHATPGPWEAYYTIHGEPFVTLPGLPITHGIAAVSTGSIEDGRDDYGRANAALIAATPELLSVLVPAARLAVDLLDAIGDPESILLAAGVLRRHGCVRRAERLERIADAVAAARGDNDG